MKSRETLIRLRKSLDERRRHVAQIERMIAEFERMAAELEREIKAEEARSGIHDPAHFAYPTYAKAAMQRRDNLMRSAEGLRAQFDAARQGLTDALEELKKAELRGREQLRAAAAAAEDAALPAVAAMAAEAARV
jgi:flagellar protein FliJ